MQSRGTLQVTGEVGLLGCARRVTTHQICHQGAVQAAYYNTGSSISPRIQRAIIPALFRNQAETSPALNCLSQSLPGSHLPTPHLMPAGASPHMTRQTGKTKQSRITPTPRERALPSFVLGASGHCQKLQQPSMLQQQPEIRLAPPLIVAKRS